MNKQKLLFFFIYCDCDPSDIYEVYKLHFIGINSFNDIFDRYRFILAFDDLDNVDFIERWKQCIISNIHTNKDIEFIVVKNNSFTREAVHFLYEVIFNMDNYKDDIVMFCHSKRDFDLNKTYLYDWIISMYFFNNYRTDEIITLLEDPNTSYYLHGSLYTQVNKDSYYVGTFYWFNPEKILNDRNFNNFRLYIYNVINIVDNEIKDSIKQCIRDLAETWMSYFAAYNNYHSWQNEKFINYTFKEDDFPEMVHFLFSPYHGSVIDNIFRYNVSENTVQDLLSYKDKILQELNK